MCGGAFEGIDDYIERRAFKDRQRIGFKPTIVDGLSADDDESKDFVRSHVNPDDLMEYGFIPEFVGRLPVVVSLDMLGKDDLVRVLTEPKNAFAKQYQSLFKMDDVELTFTDDALDAAAELALKQKTGARGLRTILEQVLLDVMYELPTMTGVARCIVDGAAIKGTSAARLITSEGNQVPMADANQEKKSA